MKWLVTPGSSLQGAVAQGSPACVPGDKSISHRAALFAALADGESVFENFQDSGVTRAMLSALTCLGVEWQLNGMRLRVRGAGLRGLKPPAQPIDCGNSATTMRLLAGALAAAGTPAVLTGTPGLLRRPMQRIVEPLQAMGVDIQASEAGGAPLRLGYRDPGARLKPIVYELPVASAQVKTCLLLAALAADAPSCLVEPYRSRDHSERMLQKMGVQLTCHETEINLSPRDSQSLKPLRMAIPGDLSAAAFLIVAALVTPGSQVRLREIGLNPTRSGILEALNSMGAQIEISNQHECGGEPVGDLIVRHSRLGGVEVCDGLVVRMIDEFPAFAVAASYAEGETCVCQAAELRHKESDRITSLCSGLVQLGVGARETEDGFVIAGGSLPRGGTAEGCGDHRLAMAFTIAGLAAQSPVSVAGVEAVSESFPGFMQVFAALGARIEEEK